MSCNRLYVEPMEALVVQASKMSLISLLKQCLESMRGKKLSYIVSTTKDTKLALIQSFFLDLRDTSQPFLSFFRKI